LRIEDEGRPDPRDFVSVVEYAEGPLEIAGVNVRALRVDHPPVTECYALKFYTPEWCVVFSADTTYFPPLADFARGCDLLVHEAMLEHGVDRIVEITGNGARLRKHLMDSHTLAPDAARIANEAGAKHLVLNHLIPADLPGFEESDWRSAVSAFKGTVSVARDGLEIRRT
ncbi:MBL fold metallo-hydrolase, partial [Roseibium hamelinense]